MLASNDVRVSVRRGRFSARFAGSQSAQQRPSLTFRPELAALQGELHRLSRATQWLVAPSTTLPPVLNADLLTVDECLQLLAVSPDLIANAQQANKRALENMTSIGVYYKAQASQKLGSVDSSRLQDERGRSTFGMLAFETSACMALQNVLVECATCRKRMLARAFVDHHAKCSAEPLNQSRQPKASESWSQPPVARPAAHMLGRPTKTRPHEQPTFEDATPPPRVSPSSYTSPKSLSWLLLPEEESLSMEAVRTIIFHARASNPNPMAVHRTRYQSFDPNYAL